jgi:Cu-Zn family superoxide dismutase
MNPSLALLMSVGLLLPLGGAEPVIQAAAEINPASGSNVHGRVVFKQEKEGVRIVAEVTGLTQGSEHGFHIHEKGDCLAPDASSAGGHFNPKDMPHAGPEAEKRHVGDLGNLVADGQGKAQYERLDTFVQLNGPESIIGRGVIVHEKDDDFTTQPTGNAGGRIGCGVIKSLP